MAKNTTIKEYAPLPESRLDEILRASTDAEKISLCLEVSMLRKVVYGTARTLDTRFIKLASDLYKQFVEEKNGQEKDIQ